MNICFRKKIIFIVFLFFSTPLFGMEIKNKLGVSIGYPYGSIRYGLSNKNVIEIRLAYGENIFVFGGRFYFLFYTDKRLNFYISPEIDGLTFVSRYTHGEGCILGSFSGFEYFLKNNFSINMDIGLAYITVWSREEDVIVSGSNIILNTGITFYFKLCKQR